MRPTSAQENSQLQHVENDLLSKINSLDPKMPKITYAERMGYYLTATNKKVYFQLINAANGQRIGQIIELFLHDPSKNVKLLTEAFTALGHQIGYLQNKFLQKGQNGQLKTIVHGDLHPWNVFYDVKSKRILLIDNNRARLGGPTTDITGFITFTCFRSLKLFRDNGQYLMGHAFKPMVEAYFSEITDENSKKIMRDSVDANLQEVITVYTNNIRPVLSLTMSGYNLFYRLLWAILDGRIKGIDTTARVNDLYLLMQPKPKDKNYSTS